MFFVFTEQLSKIGIAHSIQFVTGDNLWSVPVNNRKLFRDGCGMGEPWPSSIRILQELAVHANVVDVDQVGFIDQNQVPRTKLASLAKN